MANPSISADGSIAYGTDGHFSVFNIVSSVTGDFGFEFSIDASNTGILQRIGLWPPEVIPGTGTVHSFGFARTPGSSNSSLFAQSSPNNVALGTVNVSFSGAANDRLSIVRRGSVIALYLNYISSLSEPLLTATADRDSYKLIAVQDWGLIGEVPTVVIKKARLFNNSVKYLYSAADQTTDFGSPQSSLVVRVSQVSPLVGRGAYSQATI